MSYITARRARLSREQGDQIARNIKQIERRIQFNEAHIDAARGRSTEQLLVVTKTPRGPKVQPANTHKLEQIATGIGNSWRAELARVRFDMSNEPLEEVQNLNDEMYTGSVNLIEYYVPGRRQGRGLAQLPASLAQHYREHVGLQEKLDTYEARTGARGPHQLDPVTPMLHEDFKREVHSFDLIDHDTGVRRYWR